MQVDVKDFLGKLRDKRMTGVEVLALQRRRNEGSMSRAIQTSSMAIWGGMRSQRDIWPYRITIAAMWSGIGDTKNAMSGNLISWLCTTMMLCEVTMAAGSWLLSIHYDTR